ncbi:MAG: helix-turn-helix domain-containing protein, partial [Acidobacteria bacterium]|nr:helix-turn-helix domain-containing protein [Acidobacteriota bacterium]
MTRPRVPLGLESTRATLNRQACAEAGAVLIEARKKLGLAVTDVSARLLLSPAQVKALELVQPEAFYGAEFYAAALKKYAAFLGVDSSAVDRARVEPASGPAGDQTPFRRGPVSVTTAAPAVTPRPRNALVVAVGLIITTLAGWLLLSSIVVRPFRALDRRAETSPPRPPQPTPAPTETSEPVAAAAAPAVEETRDPAPAPMLTPISTVAEPAVEAIAPASVSAVASGEDAAEDASVGRVKVAHD